MIPRSVPGVVRELFDLTEKVVDFCNNDSYNFCLGVESGFSGVEIGLKWLICNN